MTAVDAIAQGKSCLEGLGVKLGDAPQPGNLQGHVVTPWSYNVLLCGAIVGVIATVAAAVLGQTQLIATGVIIAALGGLGAYEVKSLSLTKDLSDVVNYYHQMVINFIAQVGKLAQEKKQIDAENVKLNTEITELKSLATKADQLQSNINNIDAISKQLEETNAEKAKLVELNKQLSGQVDAIETERKKLSDASQGQVEALSKLQDQNKDLTQKVQEFEAKIAELNEGIANYSKANGQSKADLEASQKEAALMQKQIADLNKANAEMSEKAKSLDETRLKLEAATAKLQNTKEEFEKEIGDIKTLVDEKSKQLEKLNGDLKDQIKKKKDARTEIEQLKKKLAVYESKEKGDKPPHRHDSKSVVKKKSEKALQPSTVESQAK